MYDPRTFRALVSAAGLVTFEVRVAETDLQIAAARDLSGAALSAIHRIRGKVESFCKLHHDFETTLEPYAREDKSWPHEIIRMIRASTLSQTGPMSTIAGLIAEYVGRELQTESEEIIVENSGDVFIACREPRTLALYAGNSPYSMKLGLEIQPETTPLGICTSSGTTGESLSLGMCDAATVISDDAVLADAVATAIGNRVAKAEDIQPSLDWAMEIDGVLGAVVILGGAIGVRGDTIQLVEL